MKASLRALLSCVIDYAGMFPPAELSLEQAIRNYARYRTGPQSWMLGRFICPVARLGELAPLLGQLIEKNPPVSISAIGRGVDRIHDDLELIRLFEAARVDVLETRCPDDAILTVAAHPITIFLERKPGGELGKCIDSTTGQPLGFKLRTGGVDAAAFPSSRDVARAVVSCRDERIPLKFTAGLHHPFRHFDPSVHTHAHGFINVFTCGVLAHVSNLTQDELVTILDDEKPGHFRFDDDSLRYEGWIATTSQITSIRQKFLISFGSCNFEEPCDDLRALDWL